MKLLTLLLGGLMITLSACSTTVPAPPEPHWGSLVVVNKTIPDDAITLRNS